MITRTRVSVAAMLALIVLSVLYMGRVGLHVGALSDTRTARMVVPDTNGILVGSRVLLRGVEIGHVDRIEPVAGGIELTWDYSKSDQIPVDSRFRVDNLSALGESYVSVLPTSASGPYLADGVRVDSARVSVPTTFKELSARMTELLRQVNTDQVQRIFDALNVGLPEGIQVIGDLNRAGGLLAEELMHQSDSLSTLLRALQPLLMRTDAVPEALHATTPLLPGFGTGFEELLNSVRDAMLRGPLVAGIKDGASPLFAELQKFLDLTSADLNVIGVNLLPAAQAGSASMRTVDVGRALDQILSATDQRGAVSVHIPGVGIPPK